ncbi:TraR/DksA C4-type zinc finger protein [Streptomyces sp. NPDC050743]|uniref:TraR/DksA family transcriptional regulator n=1 Tax=Streptomyces sp. NPDC050743 TaxID=3365634 RepID=UPI00379024C7
MVAKRTAVQQPATGRHGGAAASGAAAVSGGETKGVDGTKRPTAGRDAQPAARKTAMRATAVKEPAAGRTAARKTAAKAPAAAEKAPGKPVGKAMTAGEETVVKKTATGKTAARKTATGRTAARKTAAEKPTAKETAAKKAAGSARKAAGKQTGAGEGPAGKAVAKKTAAKKASAEKTGGKKPAAKGAVAQTAVKKAARKAGGRKAGAEGASTQAADTSRAKKAGAARAAKQTGATTVVAKKTPGTATTETAVPKARVAAAEPGELAVRPGEDPWTPEEVAEARAELLSEVERLRAEISSSEVSLAGLMRDSGDGAGDDQADTGTKNITREHELALAANAREMLIQNEHALERLDAGTYGLCENCGDPIGKARMQAFPRATLCVECKQKQERRS